MDVEAFPKKEGGYTMYSVPSILTAALSTTCLSVRVHQLYQIAIVLMLFQHGRDGAADWRMPMEDPDDVSPSVEVEEVQVSVNRNGVEVLLLQKRSLL